MRLDDELDTSLSKYPHLRDTLAVLLLIMAKLAQIEGGASCINVGTLP